MSELYRASENSDAASAADTPVSVRTDSDARQHERPGAPTRCEGALEGDGYPGYDDGGTLAAEEEGLPARQDAWGQTCDYPEYSDESDLATVHGGDTSTLAAEEEGLPTRQEAWDQAWDAAAAERSADTQRPSQVDQVAGPRTGQEVIGEDTGGDSDTASPDVAAEASDSGVSGRPDIVARYPGDYVRSPEPPPDVTRAHEHPETWVDEINAPGADNPGRDNNCGECSRAVDNTWSGHPATAAALADRNAGGEPVERMTEWAGTSPSPTTMTEIGQRLSDLGPGSSYVFGSRVIWHAECRRDRFAAHAGAGWLYLCQPGLGGWLQASRSADVAFQGRKRSRACPDRGLPPLRPQASR